MSKNSPALQSKIIVFLIIGLIFSFYIITIWNPSPDSIRVLEDNGVTSPEVSTLSFWGCPEKQYGYNFKGKNEHGKNVQGLICKNGIFFGSWNVRYN